MNVYSYLNPSSVRSSCLNYIAYLESENNTYNDLIVKVNKFVTDDSSKGEAVTFLQNKVMNYSCIMASFVLANAYDIDDSNTLMDLVGEEILDGYIILSQKESAKSDWERYGSEASSCYYKAYMAVTPEENGYWRGQGSHYDGLASSARQIYEFFSRKEDRFDEIEAGTAELFQNSSELRSAANKLMLAISDPECSEAQLAKYRTELKGIYCSYRAGANDEIKKKVGNEEEILWDSFDNEKAFDKSTPQGKEIAELYEQKEAYKKAMEAEDNPHQKEYFRELISSIDKRINECVENGLNKSNHSKEFRFSYGVLEDQEYSEEERLKIFSYWMSVDSESDLKGKEMPEWWEKKYLNLPVNVKVDESNVTSVLEDENVKEELKNYYLKTYFILDSISGRDCKQYNADWSREENNKYDAECLRDYYNDNKTSENGYKYTVDSNVAEELMLTWFDTMYGPMRDYVSNINTVRAGKYALSEHMGFPNLDSQSGVYNYYDNEENDYYQFCKNAFIYKYNHAEDYFGDKIASSDDEKRLLDYLKEDVSKSSCRRLSAVELDILNKNFVASQNGEMIYSKNLYDMADQLQHEQTIFSNGDYVVRIEGKKIYITATIIDGMSYASENHFDTYVMDVSDCCTFAFGSYYLSKDVFAEKMLDYAKYRYNHGWVDPEALSTRKDEIDEVLRIQAKTQGIDYDSYDEITKDKLRKDALIYSDCQGLLVTTYVEKRVTASERFDHEWEQAMKFAGAALALMALANPGLATTAACCLLGTVDGTKKCIQGDTLEGATEIGISVSLFTFAAVKEYAQMKQAEELLNDAKAVAVDKPYKFDPNSVDDEILKTKPISNEKLNEMKGFDNPFSKIDPDNATITNKCNFGEYNSSRNYLTNKKIIEKKYSLESVGRDAPKTLDDPIQKGIEKILKNKNEESSVKFVIDETKFGKAHLSRDTRDGMQMTKEWLFGEKTNNNRVLKAVNNNKQLYDEIYDAFQNGEVELVLSKVDQFGNVKTFLLEQKGNVMKIVREWP